MLLVENLGIVVEFDMVAGSRVEWYQIRRSNELRNVGLPIAAFLVLIYRNQSNK